MDIDQLDLNLLRVFDALMRTRSVTLAGDALNLSQPAVSYALAKLRTFTGDALFVRTVSGMEPTPLAMQMAEPVRHVMDVIRREVFQKDQFCPADSDRVFTLSMSDIGEMVFLPRLLTRLKQEAPGVVLKTVSMPPARLEEAMVAGEVDLAVGYFPDITKANFYQQHLFTHTFASLVRSDHPVIKRRMSMKQFLDATHVVIRAEGRSLELFEHYLAEQNIHRHIGLVIPHFMSVPHILQASDMIATVPKSCAEAFARFGTTRIVELPFPAPEFDLKQYWHARLHGDAANQWLRHTLYDCFISGIE